MTAHQITEEMGLKHESVGVGSNEHFVQRVTSGPNLTRISITCKDMRPLIAKEGNRRIGKQNVSTTNASNTHVFLVSQFKSFENGLCVFREALQNSSSEF